MSSSHMRRNKTIDIFRGLTMMYVIFIHCLYWPGLFNEGYAKIIKSLFLIEMPLFFVITGASNYLSRTNRLSKFYISRFSRIFVPYLVYAFLCIVLTIIYAILTKTSVNAWQIVLSWIIPIDRQITSLPYITWALWFIPVYVFVILLFPFMKKLFTKGGVIKYALPVVLALTVFSLSFISSEKYGMLYYIQSTVFYCFWAYIGMFFISHMQEKSFKEKIKIVLPILLICIACEVIMVFVFNHTIDMQINKFPPNALFFVHSAGALSVIYLLTGVIERFFGIISKNKIVSWIFKEYSKNSYSIFLYHPFSFMVAMVCFKVIPVAIPHYVMFVLYFIITLIMSAIISKIFYRFEKIKLVK